MPEGTMSLFIEYHITQDVITIFAIPYKLIQQQRPLKPEIQEKIKKEFDLAKLR
jgi:hypothetical protein